VFEIAAAAECCLVQPQKNTNSYWFQRHACNFFLRGGWLDKPEKAAATVLQQLNAIRNAKAKKRRAASNRYVVRGGGGVQDVSVGTPGGGVGWQCAAAAERNPQCQG
jgi:hypothetical protein